MKFGYEEKFKQLLKELESPTFSANSLDLKEFELEGAEIDEVLKRLAGQPSIQKADFGQAKMTFSQSSKLRILLRKNTPINPVAEGSLVGIKKDKMTKEALLFQEVDSFQEDLKEEFGVERKQLQRIPAHSINTKSNNYNEYGNPKRAALFETKLALIILKNSSVAVLERINDAIVEYIEKNISIQKKMNHPTQGIKYLLEEHHLIASIDSNFNALEFFKQFRIKDPKDILNCSTLHKLFFENFFDPTLVNSQLTKDPIPSLAMLAQSVLRKEIKNGEKNTLEVVLRPDKQFSEENRGRRAIGKEKSTRHFGIMSEQDLPSWGKNWHANPIPHAKDIYCRDLRAPLIQYMEKYNLPFASGPSGTVGYVLGGAILLLGLSTKDMKAYVNLLAAAEIALGHHSFFEVMQVAANLKFFYSIEYPGKLFANHQKPGLVVSPHISPEQLYETCLTPDLKQTKEYMELAKEFPEYLGSEKNGLPVKRFY